MSEAELVAAEEDLRGINAGALIVRTCRSQVDLAAVLDRGLYRLRSDSAVAPGQAAVSLLQVRPDASTVYERHQRSVCTAHRRV
jgi:G3E family GTPase